MAHLAIWQLKFRQQQWWHYIVVALWALLLNLNTLGHGYVYDDVGMIEHNDKLKEGWRAVGYFTTHDYATNDNSLRVYRPVLFGTLALEGALFGFSPAVFHAFNVLYFGILCVLLLYVLRCLFFNYSRWWLLAVVLLYAALPVLAESVSSVKGRDDTLCFVFMLLCLLTFWRCLHQPRYLYYIAGGILFLLGYWAKETMITTFAILLPTAALAVAEGHTTYKHAWQRGLPFFGIILVIFCGYVAFRYIMLPSPISTFYEYPLYNSLLAIDNPSHRLATAIYIVGKYLALVFVPYPLCYNYAFAQIPEITLANPVVWAVVLLHIGLIYFFIRYYRQVPLPILWGVAFYYITLSPFLHLSKNFVTMAERFLFIPSLGIVLAVTAAYAYYIGGGLAVEPPFQFSRKQIANVALLAVLMLGYSYARIGQNALWKNNYALFVGKWQNNQNSAVSKYDMAHELYEKYTQSPRQSLLNDTIIPLYKAALVQYPNYKDAEAEVITAYINDEKYEEALSLLHNAVKRHKEIGKYYYQIGFIYYIRGEYNEALPFLTQAVHSKYEEVKKYHFLVNTYFHVKPTVADALEQALQIALKGLQEYPNDLVLQKQLALIYRDQGDNQKGLQIAEKILANYPNDSETLKLAANIARNIGDTLKMNGYIKKLMH